jgi:hypothetical protein
MAKDTYNLAVTNCPIHGGVFGRFVYVLSNRLGDIQSRKTNNFLISFSKIFLFYLDNEYNDGNRIFSVS